MDPLNSGDVDDYRACTKLFTADTRAQVWDIDLPGRESEVLDDATLRAMLTHYTSFWEGDKETEAKAAGLSKLVLVTTIGEPSKARRALQIRENTLRYLVNIAGVPWKTVDRFFTTSMPSVYYCLQYDDDDDTPTSMTVIFFRCPKNTNCVSGIIRVQFATRKCFAFLSCCYEEDVFDILKRCSDNIDLLKIHPLYLLSFIYDHRFQRWTDWFARLWKEVVELESVTNMTHPFWKMSQMDAERLQALSTGDALLTQLHATHLELCHSHTVMSFATKFGNVCSSAADEMEKRRHDLGYSPLSRRHASGLEDTFKTILVRCDSMADRLSELSNRLRGQINVSYNLIAQKDSKVNVAIAKLQAHDSQRVKGIAVLTLLFLPPTLLAHLERPATGCSDLAPAQSLPTFIEHLTGKMVSLARLALFLGIFASLIPGCVATEFGDDFANNLLTDLAPLLTLFGERVTMQFMSQSTGWADSFALAMAPIGIITIIVSAIRVGGPSWLKAIIGRARENLAAAEVDLMSSTSKEVCELWNGSEIIRCMGSAPVREFICLVPRSKRLGSNVEIEITNTEEAQNRGFLVAQQETQDAEKAEATSITVPDRFEKLRESLQRKRSERKAAAKIIVARNMLTDAPNISLNVHPQNRTEVRAVAAIGTILQLGVLVYGGLATYYPPLKFPKKEKEPVGNYAFPCTATGTLLLVIGLLLCADVVEGRTEEVTHQTKHGYDAWTIWVQQKSTVGDQIFGSFAVFASKPRTELTTSRRAEGTPTLALPDKIVIANASRPLAIAKFLKNMFVRNAKRDSVSHAAESQAQEEARGAHQSLWSSKAASSAIFSVLGYFVQFVGLRGMHWSVSIVQLGTVLAMTALRAWVRRGLAVAPNAQSLSPGFELDWLASTIVDRNDGPWANGSFERPSYGKSWHISTGGSPDFEPLDKVVGANLFTGHGTGQFDLGEAANGTKNGGSCLPPPKTQTVMELRSQLGELAGWQGPALPEAKALSRAIEAVMKSLFARAFKERFTWLLRAKYGESKPATVKLTLRRENGNWTIDRRNLESVLSLWIHSVHEQRRTEPTTPEEKVNSSATESPNLRLLGRDTPQLRRDLQWWMPHGLVRPIAVTESAKGSLRVDISRIVGHGRGEPTWARKAPTASFKKDELDEIEFDPIRYQNTKNSLLAMESFTTMKSLYALDLLSSFMWSVAETLTEPIKGQAVVQSNDMSGVGSWKSFTLHHPLLETMAKEIQSTGLASLTEVYASIIPPLSQKSKLPQVDGIVELAREHAKPYERQGDMKKATDDYIWLFQIANTFASRNTIAARAAAVMVEHLVRVTQDVELWEQRKGPGSTADLRKRIEDELGLRKDDVGEILVWLVRLYQFQGRIRNLNLPLPRRSRIGKKEVYFPNSFQVTELHQLTQDGVSDALPGDKWADLVNTSDVTGWNPLHYAVAHANDDIATELVGMGADVNARDLLGWTPLHYACQEAYADTAGLLINKGADVNAQARNGLAPLYCAAISGHKIVAELLVKAGAHINITDSSRTTPAMWAAVRGHQDVLGYLWKDTNRKLRDVSGRTVLHLAALSGNAKVIDVCGGTDTEARDRDRRTLLQLCVLNEHEDASRVLATNLGAAKDVVDDFGRSLLHLASSKGFTSIIKLLVIELDADVNHMDYNGRVSMHIASQEGQVAAIELLNDLGADINFRGTDGKTPFYLATEKGQVACMNVLKSLGADLELTDANGITPLFLACEASSVEIVNQLLALGASKEARGAGEMTPLHIAARRGNERVVQLLVEAGSDIESRDIKGMTPLHEAARRGRERVVQVLLAAGAEREVWNKRGYTPRALASRKNLKIIVSALDRRD
ncbi:hypothetical protein ACJZ2D_014679 [Fusarium nematophilum]